MTDFSRLLSIPDPVRPGQMIEGALGDVVYTAISGCPPDLKLSPPQIVAFGSFALRVKDGGEHEVDVDPDLLATMLTWLRPMSMAAVACAALGIAPKETAHG